MKCIKYLEESVQIGSFSLCVDLNFLSIYLIIKIIRGGTINEL